MICPFRTGVKFNIDEVAKAVVLKSQEEYYPECYEYDCPFYSYTGKCEAVDRDLNK